MELERQHTTAEALLALLKLSKELEVTRDNSTHGCVVVETCGKMLDETRLEWPFKNRKKREGADLGQHS